MSELKAILDTLDASLEAPWELTLQMGKDQVPLSEVHIEECGDLCAIVRRTHNGKLEGFLVAKSSLELPLSSKWAKARANPEQLARLESSPICYVEEPQERQTYY